MARFRRAALGLLAVGVAAGAAVLAGFVLAGGDKPGSLVIVNHGTAPVRIPGGLPWSGGTA